MIKFEKIKPGMVLWDCRKQSSFRGKEWATWPVFVKEVDSEKRRILASWNHNKAEWISEKRATKYRAKRPRD